MADTNGRRGVRPGGVFGSQRSDNESQDLSSSFDQISRNLDVAAKQLGKNTGSLKSQGFHLDKNTAALLKVAESFSKSVGNFVKTSEGSRKANATVADQTKKSQQAMVEDMEEVFYNNDKKTKGNLSTFQKISSGLIGSLKVVGSRFAKEFTGALDRQMAAYKESFTDITVRMQMDREDYSKMFREITSDIVSDGLKKQFSTVDFTKSLESALSNGLRGDEAKRQAYQNMITNKLVPAISTNTVAYRKMSKTFGEAFDENTRAVAKYTEALYGGEGLEEGKLNNLIDSVETTFRWAVSQGQMTSEQAQKSIAGLQMSFSALENAGVNTDEFTSMINSALKGDNTAITKMMHYAGISDPSDMLSKLANDSVGFVNSIVQAYNKQGAGLSTLNQTAGSLEGNLQTSQEVTAAFKYNPNLITDVYKDLNNFDYSAENTKYLKKLADGQYQTKDAQQDKLQENTVAGLATITSEIPRFHEIATDIKGILALVTKIALTPNSGISLKDLASGESLSEMTSGSKDVLNLGKLGSTGNATVSGTGLAGKLASYGYNHGASAGATGASALGQGLLSIAAGPVALAAGLGLMTYHGISTGINNGNAGAGLLASVTGDSNIGLTESQKLDKANSDLSKGWVSGSGIDWKKVAKNTGTGALVGAGVGTIAGGWAAGAGTAIGAGVGAVTGAVASIVDQAVESAKYNKLAKASEQFSKSLEKSQDAVSEFGSVAKKSQESLSNLDILTGKTAATESQKLSALESLKSEYPALLHNVKDLSDWDSKYVETVKKKVEQENNLAASKALDAVQETLESAKKEIESTSGLSKNFWGTSQAIGSTMKEFGDEVKNVSTKEEFDKVVSKYAAKYGTSNEEFLKIAEDQIGLKYGTDSAKTVHGVYVPEKFWHSTTDTSKYDSSGVRNGYDTTELANQAQSRYTSIFSTLSQLETMYNGWSESGELKIPQVSQKPLSGRIEDFVEVVKAYNVLANQLNYDPLKSDDSSFSFVKEMAQYVGAPFNFKVGAYNIPRDNVLANLHQGEMVLTSENAKKLRNLGSGGVSGLLDQLTAVSEAKVAPQSSNITSDVSTAIVTAIKSQTETLVSAISTVISVINNTSKGRFVTTSETNSRLINFEGV